MPHTPRAFRFPIAVKVLYREIGEPAWHQAASVNASRTGILIETSKPLPVGARVELILALSETWGEPTPADILCVGKIARSNISSCERAPPFTMAATIESHIFIRNDMLRPS
jgi:hypothetical protein